MRVRIKENCRVFHGHVPHDLKEGQEVTGSLAEMLLTRASAKVERVDVDDVPEEEAPAHREPCVDGSVCDGPHCPPELDINASVAKVLEWAGQDKDRAAEALQGEQDKEKPRATLVKALTAVLEA